MAPIKFEENIKDKLEKRTLSPSSEGWSKLSERLDADEKKSKKPIYWWLSIAAGLIIMIAVSVKFFNSKDTKEVMPQVVEDKVKMEQIERGKPEQNNTKSIDLVNEDNRVEENEENARTLKESKNVIYKKETIKKPESKTQFAELSKSTKSDTSNAINKTVNNELQKEIDDATIKNAVVEAMKTLKSENNAVTDREIDSLLKIASKELFKDESQKESSTMVDATQLLESVEDEMGQSYRGRVYEALKDSYKTIKTAVVNRNN